MRKRVVGLTLTPSHAQPKKVRIPASHSPVVGSKTHLEAWSEKSLMSSHSPSDNAKQRRPTEKLVRLGAAGRMTLSRKGKHFLDCRRPSWIRCLLEMPQDKEDVWSGVSLCSQRLAHTLKERPVDNPKASSNGCLIRTKMTEASGSK
jgi:hypothetical protein